MIATIGDEQLLVGAEPKGFAVSLPGEVTASLALSTGKQPAETLVPNVTAAFRRMP